MYVETVKLNASLCLSVSPSSVCLSVSPALCLSVSDEDECVSLPGVCGSARCENVEGSFMCECDRRGDEFDAGSRRCVGAARAGTTETADHRSDPEQAESGLTSEGSFIIVMIKAADVPSCF